MKESTKKKLESIDKSKIKVQESKDLLAKIEKALNNDKNEENQAKAEKLLDVFIAKAKAKNADIFKTEAPAKPKTPTQKKQVAQATKSKLDALMDTIANDPLFKDFNSPRRVKGGGRSDALIDSERKARESGRRVSQKGWKNQYGKSKGGRRYYEYRENRIDRKAPNYGSRPWLEDGGLIHPSDKFQEKYSVIEIKGDGSRKVHNTFPDFETAMVFASLKRNVMPSNTRIVVEDDKGTTMYRSFKSGGEMSDGGKYYVMDAKDGKIVSKGFDTEEEAKAEMYKIFEKTRNPFLVPKKMAHGGEIDESTAMVLSQNKAIAHHTEELKNALSKNPKVEPWVVGKIERASTDISDVTHYLDGRNEYAKGGYMADGGNVYSSDNLYILKVYDGETGDLLDMSKRVWARNLNKAQEIAMDEYEYDMKEKYGDYLKFKVEEAPSMFAKGGEIEVSVGDKVKSKSGVDGVVYESTGTMFKIEDKYGKKSPKWHSSRDFKPSEITKSKGGDSSTWDKAVYNSLKGKSILIYSMGVKTPMNVKITGVTPPDTKFSIPTLVLETGKTEERIEGKSKIEDFMNGKEVELYDGKEYYAIELETKVKSTTKNMDYTKRRNLKLIVIKNPNKNGSKNYLTIDKSDFLNGLHKFEEGGNLSKEYTYIKRADVNQVVYRDSNNKDAIDFKPKNGFWVSKKALVEAGMNETKSQPKKLDFGTTSMRKTSSGWIAKNKVSNYMGYDWEITTMKSMRGDLVSTAVGGKNEKSSSGYTMFTYVMYQDPNVRLITSKPSRITEKVTLEQQEKALKEFETKVTDKWYAKGGKIVDQYEGRTAEDIWNNLDKSQRQHFLYDHAEEIEEYRGEEYGELNAKEIMKAYNSDWSGLDKHIKNRFSNHVREGEYAKGGKIGFEGLSKKVAKNYEGKKVAPKYRKEYGETYDKKEAKEVGDKVASKVYRQQLTKMEKGGKLPEDLDKYFIKTSKTKVVEMSDLKPLRARPTGIENAEKYMRMAYEGKMEKRKPITIYKSQGKYRVYDGNSTYAVAKANGWEKIWAEVIKNPNMNTYGKRGKDIFTIAKEIRKEGEAWKDALQRAKAMK